MPSPEKPRWIDEKGESTPHAREIAEKTKTQLNELSEDVKRALPAQTDLNMAEHTVTAGETVTSIIGKELTAAKYNNSKLLRLSYGHMFKQADAQKENINLLRVGDKLKIENGKLTITREAGNSFSVDIYPWEKPAAPGQPKAPNEKPAAETPEEKPAAPKPEDGARSGAPSIGTRHTKDEFGGFPPPAL